MPKRGFIYLFKRNDGWFKIGRTADLEKRFRAWSWESRVNNWDLVLYGIVEVKDCILAEKSIHAIFDGCRTDERHLGLGPRHELFALNAADIVRFWSWAATTGEHFIKTKLDIESPTWLSALRGLING
jgi:hypothetical protein